MQTQRKFSIPVSGLNSQQQQQQQNRYGMSDYMDRGFPTGPPPIAKSCGSDTTVSVTPINPQMPQSGCGCGKSKGEVGPVKLMTCSKYSGGPLGPDYAANPYAYQQGPWAPFF